jgi:hypothetical protein
METLIVYGLVLLFFVLLAIFVVAVLAAHPYAEPPAAVQKSSAASDSMIVYGVLGVIVTFLFVIMLLSERERSHMTASSGSHSSN